MLISLMTIPSHINLIILSWWWNAWKKTVHVPFDLLFFKYLSWYSDYFWLIFNLVFSIINSIPKRCPNYVVYLVTKLDQTISLECFRCTKNAYPIKQNIHVWNFKRTDNWSARCYRLSTLSDGLFVFHGLPIIRAPLKTSSSAVNCKQEIRLMISVCSGRSQS